MKYHPYTIHQIYHIHINPEQYATAHFSYRQNSPIPYLNTKTTYFNLLYSIDLSENSAKLCYSSVQYVSVLTIKIYQLKKVRDVKVIFCQQNHRL